MLITRFAAILFVSFLLCGFTEPGPVAGQHGMVVSENALASEAGAEILRAGGNAIDAAVAVGYALAVVNPCCGNLGGGGFMTIHLANGTEIFINFREKAPLKATKNMYLDAHGNVIPTLSTRGYLAVAVPGTVLGLDTALQKYGSMNRQQVIAPAIKLATQGYIVTPTEAHDLASYETIFRTQPNIAAIFMNHGQPFQPGELLVQSDLAATLKLIASKGPDAFYKGAIAKTIVAASQANGGILSMDDFAKYNVEELKPIHCTYNGYSIASAPPPSSGGVALCEMLNILENFPMHQLRFHTAKSMYYTVEAMRYGFTDRNSKMGDPNFVKNPVDQLISKSYAAQISQQIATMHVPYWRRSINQAHEYSDTTHYSVIDDKGNAVAVTYTLNGMYGAKVIAGNTGFFLNDEMDDFSAKSGAANMFGLVMSDTNSIQPGKRPLSSMSPTIITKNGHLFMVVGSPGGPRIITSVLQTILNVIDFDMNIQEAVDAPRFHYQVIPDNINVEPLGFSFFLRKQLELMGYHIVTQGTWSAVEAILIDPENGTFYGANDARRPDGAAVGY